MTRFYVFSFILSVLIGMILYRMLELRSLDLISTAAITLLSLLLFLNEKKAVLENKLGKRSRRILAFVGVIALAILWIVTLLQVGLLF